MSTRRKQNHAKKHGSSARSGKHHDPENLPGRNYNSLFALAENTHAHLAYLDPQFNFIDVNSMYIRGCGHTREELIGKNHFELFPNPGNQAIFEQVRETGEPIAFRAKAFEFIDQPERGTTYWDWTLVPVKDRGGIILGLVLSLLDVTDRVEAEAELKHSEQRYSLAQRVAGVGSWDWNIRTGGLFWSEQIEPMFGFAPGTFGRTYKAFLESVHPDDRDRLVESVTACIERDEDYKIEHRIIRPDGAIRWVEEAGNVFRDRQGQAVRMLGIVRDITDRKLAQEEIQELNSKLKHHAEELIAANQELEACSYSVSHDLRAPLRSIDGFGRALLEDCSERLDEQGRDYLRRIRAATSRMGQLIDDLLTLSRITRLEINRIEVDLSSLARFIAAQLQETQPDRQARFIIADGLVVQGDIRLLQIALENLLGNAWKFTGKVPAATIELGVERHDDQTVYFVRDNGAGFDMRYSEKIFIPFQRLHSLAEFPGSGIGMPIVWRIITRHGGRIWGEGTEGKGATFYFTL